MQGMIRGRSQRRCLPCVRGCGEDNGRASHEATFNYSPDRPRSKLFGKGGAGWARGGKQPWGHHHDRTAPSLLLSPHFQRRAGPSEKDKQIGERNNHRGMARNGRVTDRAPTGRVRRVRLDWIIIGISYPPHPVSSTGQAYISPAFLPRRTGGGERRRERHGSDWSFSW